MSSAYFLLAAKQWATAKTSFKAHIQDIQTFQNQIKKIMEEDIKRGDVTNYKDLKKKLGPVPPSITQGFRSGLGLGLRLGLGVGFNETVAFIVISRIKTVCQTG